MIKPLGRDAIYLADYDAKAVFERDGLLDDLKKALAERILNAEPTSWSGERASGGHEVYARIASDEWPAG
jgi:hypothetical protein